MSDPSDARLRELLGAAPPAAVLELPAADVAAFADLLAASRDRQAASLQAAFTASLRHVPFPVRGLVKKVLLG
jgi:hypothetical protein